MSAAHFILGIRALVAGVLVIALREAITSRHRRRTERGTPALGTSAYVLMGWMLVLVGEVQVIAAFV